MFFVLHDIRLEFNCSRTIDGLFYHWLGYPQCTSHVFVWLCFWFQYDVQWSISLYLCPHHLTVALFLSDGNFPHPRLFSLFRDPSWNWMLFKIILTSSWKNAVDIQTVIVLNLQINLGRIDIFVILKLCVHADGIRTYYL